MIQLGDDLIGMPTRFEHAILGNEDWRPSDRLTEEALAKSVLAVPSPDDPPEFAGWLATLQDRSLPNQARKAVMEALYDLFDPQPNSPSPR